MVSNVLIENDRSVFVGYCPTTLNKIGRLLKTFRQEEMFKSGVYNIYPLETEQVLEARPVIDNAEVVYGLYREVGYTYLQFKAQTVLIAYICNHGLITTTEYLNYSCLVKTNKKCKVDRGSSVFTYVMPNIEGNPINIASLGGFRVSGP